MSDPSRFLHACVAEIHDGFRSGALTAAGLVEAGLARIAALDRAGPGLQALLAVHSRALDEARQRDEHLRRAGVLAGPLHGIPVVLKDNFHTHDLPTTAGSRAFAQFRPARDAFVVERLRRAGALVLAKTNLQELARGGVSLSTLGGQVRNPYDLSRSAGGSSGGTGAALAAGYATLGTGSDTGQSIRSPASACALVGVRPTRGLVSRAGVMPNSFTQDEVGPLARCAEDAARLLDVMAGFDPEDPVTGLAHGRRASCVAALAGASLRGARIGVLENLFGREARHAEVNAVLEQAIGRMAAAGATIERVRLEGLDELVATVSTDLYEAAAAFDAYLARLGDGAPVPSFRALVERGDACAPVQQQLEAELAVAAEGLAHPVYRARMLQRDRLRVRLAATLAGRNLDALLYPLQRILVAPLGASEQPERNGALSHGTGLPAVCFPAGFSAPGPSAPLGVPVGAELLGPEFGEPRLLALVHAWEQVAGPWQPPVLPA